MLSGEISIIEFKTDFNLLCVSWGKKDVNFAIKDQKAERLCVSVSMVYFLFS